MILRTIEIRDRNTFIPAVAIKMEPANEAQRYLLARVGFRDGVGVALMVLSSQKATADPYEWTSLGMGPRTMPVVHEWLLQHFDEVVDGDVIDVEFILGETPTRKVSERLTVT
jgi:hypothetical protein